ncbi:MAG: ATP-binding protein [Acidobacteria bacterium]|nr:ATP-binding protein [Acidobacteriota bacterium]
MITRIEALNYRSLRYVAQDVRPFHLLVGPNASGKSTFLDVVSLLGDLVRVGLPGAIEGDARLSIPERAPDARQLVWMRQGKRFELAVEAEIPPERKGRLLNGGFARVRYELAVVAGDDLGIENEAVWLLPDPPRTETTRSQMQFPLPEHPPDHIVHLPRKRPPAGWKKVISRGEDASKVTFSAETSGWNNPFRVRPAKLALASLPEDEAKFPVATWFKQALVDGIQRVALSSDALRRPSPPGRAHSYFPDGSGLPWMVDALRKKHSDRHHEWVQHLRQALPQLVEVTTRPREEDRHRYVVLKHSNGLETPSWLVSDGTLRLLALTILAYAPDVTGVFLIEEPENGIHPRAVETIIQSLSSAYGAQILCATHSPVAVSIARAGDILCFARDTDGATDIVQGDLHPRLRDWKGEADLGTLFAGGVLG